MVGKRPKRLENFQIYLYMLTARDTNTDMVRGLNTGAGDYTTIPFDEAVLIARI